MVAIILLLKASGQNLQILLLEEVVYFIMYINHVIKALQPTQFNLMQRCEYKIIFINIGGNMGQKLMQNNLIRDVCAFDT